MLADPDALDGDVGAGLDEVRAPFVTMFRIRDGKLSSHRAYWDMAGFMAQLAP